jgi:integrase
MKHYELHVRIKFRPDRGTWYAYWRTQDGEKKAQSFGTEAEAERFKTEFTTRLITTPDPPATTPAKRNTVGGYLTGWLETTIKPHREAATYRSYEQLVRIHIVPTMGGTSLKDLGPIKVREFYQDLYDKGVKLGTRRGVHRVFSSAMTQAIFDEVIDSNPCLKLGRFLRHKNEDALDPEPNPFTADQAAAFLKDVETHERGWFEYFQFLHDTGCRVGEVAALRWAKVDLEGKRARIERSYSPSDGKDKDPKTHQRRWIDLSDLVVAQLKDLRKHQRIDLMKRGRTDVSYVFTNTHGAPRRQDGNMRRVFARVLQRALVDPVTKQLQANGRRLTKDDRAILDKLAAHTPHDLRDTFATTHLLLDYNRLPWVSRQLGHETERTTMEHYFGFLPSSFTKGFANGIRRTGDQAAEGGHSK